MPTRTLTLPMKHLESILLFTILVLHSEARIYQDAPFTHVNLRHTLAIYKNNYLILSFFLELGVLRVTVQILLSASGFHIKENKIFIFSHPHGQLIYTYMVKETYHGAQFHLRERILALCHTRASAFSAHNTFP